PGGDDLELLAGRIREGDGGAGGVGEGDGAIEDALEAGAEVALARDAAGGVVEGARLLLGASEALLELLARGDVGVGAAEQQRAPAGVALEAGAVVDPDHRAVGLDPAVLDVERLAVLAERLVRLEHPAAIVGVEAVAPELGVAHPLVHAVAHDVDDAVAVVERDAGGDGGIGHVRLVDGFQEGLGEGAEARLGALHVEACSATRSGTATAAPTRCAASGTWAACSQRA